MWHLILTSHKEDTTSRFHFPASLPLNDVLQLYLICEISFTIIDERAFGAKKAFRVHVLLEYMVNWTELHPPDNSIKTTVKNNAFFENLFSNR